MEPSDEDLIKEAEELEIKSFVPNSENDIYQENRKYNEISSSSDGIYGTVTVGTEELEINDTDATIVCYIRSDKRDEIKLGMYVIIPYPNKKDYLFGRVSRIRYKHVYPTDDATEIHSERASMKNLDEKDYKLIVNIDPICILYPKQSGKLDRKMVDKIPKPDSSVTHFSEKTYIQIGLNLPTKGIFLGHVAIGGEKVVTKSSPPTVAYYLHNDYENGDPLLFRHLIVCGGTGTGKTFFTKNIFRQFIGKDIRYNLRDEEVDKQPCLVILDPQNEYSQLNENNPALKKGNIESWSAENIKFGGLENVRTFIAKVEGENYRANASAPTTEFTIPFNMVKHNPWLIYYGSEMTENQVVALDRLLEDYFNQPGPHTCNGFVNRILDDNIRATYVPDQIHDATYASIRRRISNSVFSKVFDQGARSLIDMLSEIFEPGRISVFPTEYINSQHIKNLIILAIMTTIVDNKLSTSGKKEIKNVPIILCLDEAHRYLSLASNPQERIIVSKFANAARQGRKESLGLFLITQDPQDIDVTIMKQINTKIVLNLNNEKAISSLMIPKEFAKRIPFLKRGQAIVHSPDNSDTVEISGLDSCVVKHA